MLSCTQALRTATFLTLHPLFIPLVVSLCHAYTCTTGDVWLNTGLVCYGSIHIAIISGVTLVLTTFAVTAIVGTCRASPCDTCEFEHVLPTA